MRKAADRQLYPELLLGVAGLQATPRLGGVRKEKLLQLLLLLSNLTAS